MRPYTKVTFNGTFVDRPVNRAARGLRAGAPRFGAAAGNGNDVDMRPVNRHALPGDSAEIAWRTAFIS